MRSFLSSHQVLVCLSLALATACFSSKDVDDGSLDPSLGEESAAPFEADSDAMAPEATEDSAGLGDSGEETYAEGGFGDTAADGQAEESDLAPINDADPLLGEAAPEDTALDDGAIGDGAIGDGAIDGGSLDSGIADTQEEALDVPSVTEPVDGAMDSDLTTDSTLPADEALVADTEVPAASNGSGEVVYYTVQPGDSLSKISLKYFNNLGRWRELAEWNSISNPNLIFPNQKIKVIL